MLGLFLILLGLVFALAAYDNARVFLTASRWVTAPAEITYTYALRYSGGSKQIPSRFEYQPYFTYSFVAMDGKTYSHSGYGTAIRAFSEDQKELTDHPQVVHSDIYYDPKNPNDSDITRPLPIPVIPLLSTILGLSFFGLGWVAIKEGLSKYVHK